MFLESSRSSYEQKGYASPAYVGAPTVLGYASPNVDTDGDSLIDGFERVIGTNPAVADSDGDGPSDGVEYPASGIPLSDPCSSGNACNVVLLFENGFE